MDLHDWDTAFATTIAAVNKQLAAPSAVLAGFNITEQGMTVQGKFGPWSIVAGGSGQLLHLQTAIASGTISGGTTPKADLAGLAVELEINLQFLPSTLAKHQDLGFHFKSVGKAGTPSPPGVVTPLRVVDPAKKLTFLQQAVLGAAVAEYLVQQASSIAFRFASINLVSLTATGSWLTPVSCGYAYYQTTDGAGFLVILSVTDARSTAGLSLQIDPELTTGAATGFFAISNGMFLQHVVQPVLPKVYPGTDASFFAYDAAHKSLKCTKAFGIGGVKSGAITYYPTITSLQISVSGSNVVAVASGNCDMKMGMSLTFSVTSTSASSFDVAKATISLAKDPHPQSTHESHIPWYDYLMGAIPDIIMAIVVPAVANGIGSGLTDAIKGLSFSQAGPQSVEWAGLKKFTITGGKLNHALRIWGNLS